MLQYSFYAIGTCSCGSHDCIFEVLKSKYVCAVFSISEKGRLIQWISRN